MYNGGLTYNPGGRKKNFKSLSVVCFWAGAFGLIQSVIWIILTILGILSYSCVLSVKGTLSYGSLFQVVFLQLYFMGTCSESIPVYDDSMLHRVTTVLSPENLLIWNSVYLAVAVCWLLASILLMTNLKENQPRLANGILWTWILVTLGICAMDLALGTIFGIDYGRFSREAYKYNLSSVYAGTIYPDAAQLLAGMVVSMSLLVVSLKGFVLWILNVFLLVYLAMRVMFIGQDKSEMENLFMPRKEYDEVLTVTRPPINAYQEEEQKPGIISTVFSNGGFEPDSRVQENTAIINREIIARAARLSTDVSLHENRFRNLDNFHQYPPRLRPESMMPEQSTQQPVTPTSPIVVAAFPAPDYTPPMQRAAQNPNRNQRFQ